MLRYALLICSAILLYSCRETVNLSNPEEDPEGLSPRSKIYVTSPAQYELWRQSTINNILWTSTAEQGNVMIELLKKGRVKLIIANSTENDGNYRWNIPSSIENSNMYYIRITFLENPSLTFESEEFSIRDF
jgi:hypothetical protein